MLYNSIFAPLGELKMSVLKMHQSRQMCEEQTATSKSVQMDPRKSELLQHIAHPLTQLLCHHPTQSSLRQSLTKGATWENSGSEIPSKLKTLGLCLTSGQFKFLPKVEGKCIGHFWDGGFGQRDAKAGFSLGFIIDMEMSGCSGLASRQSSLIQDVPMVAPHQPLPPCLGFTAATLSFLLFPA